jgi:hypothetical protein
MVTSVLIPMAFTKIPQTPNPAPISVLPMSSHSSSTSSRFTRRQFAQAFLTTMTGSLLSSSSAAGSCLRSFLSDPSLSDESTSSFLDIPQRTALAELCEALVPGSHSAHSPAFIDLLLSTDSSESQKQFLTSLAAIESEAQKVFQTPIATLSQAQLHELLTGLSTQAHPAHKHFANLKDWSVTAYYSSEIGMRELGWTPDRVFATIPECQHPDGHI